MPDVPPIDITLSEWQIVRDILHRHVPAQEVWAFGSRARRQAKPWSDLDLVILGDEPLPLSVLAGLDEDFSDSDLPWKVDVLDWATISEAFREHVARSRVVIQSGLLLR